MQERHDSNANMLERCLSCSTPSISTLLKYSGGQFNIKISSYQYRKSHCGDKAILRPFYLHNGTFYTGKMTSLYWIRAQGGHFKNTYELLNLRALKFSPVNKIRIFQCMGMIFCVEFQRYPLKFHTKYLTHTLKVVTFKQQILRALRFKSSYAFLKCPQDSLAELKYLPQ